MQIIELTNRTGLDYLAGLVARGRDFRPVLPEIGEDMTESTKARFASATSPDGTPWAANSAVTLANYSALFARGKDGALTKRSAQKLGAKKPLQGETGALASTINYQVLDSQTVGIGSPTIYASTHQYGAQSGEFGFGVYAARVGSFPIPWGNIPARPFLGASEADKANIVDLVRRYMREE